MRIQVAYVGPAGAMLVELDVEPGTTASDAVARSGIADRIGHLHIDNEYAIFGRRIAATAALADGDRVEVTLPLAGDANAARRRRAAKG